jgi:heme a synthase
VSVSTIAGAAPVAATPRFDAVAAWLFGCCGLIFLMVVVGGITRLTLSGLSITEWQPLSGVIPPLTHAQWLAEFERYKQVPEYAAMQAGMTLAGFKGIFWWEYAHRLLGRVIGLAFALPYLWFLWRRRLGRALRWPLALILALGAAQGALGWYMVESGLSARIGVSQYRLAAHLALALALYGAILWAALGRVRGPAAGASPEWRRAGSAILGLVGLTLVAGAFVAGLHAGFIFNTFPLMAGSFVPPDYAQLQPLARNWFENVAAVQFDHRLLAETTVAAVALAWIAGLRSALPRPARLALHALLGVALLQFGLGVATLLLVVPLPLAAAHQANAVLLLTASIVFRHSLRPAL